MTEYLSKGILDYNKNSTDIVITSAAGHTRSNKQLLYEDDNHDEADTLMICLAAEAAHEYPDAQLVFFTPDTDVLVLALA